MQRGLSEEQIEERIGEKRKELLSSDEFLPAGERELKETHRVRCGD